MMLSAAHADILQAAVLAPSADNHHRLRFEPTAKGLMIWSPAGRLANLTGYKRTLDLLSLGAVIENIVVRAGIHHLSTQIELFPAGQADRVARITLQPAACAPDPLAAAIPLRHSNRRFFKGPPANDQTQQRIAEAAGQIPGCRLDWLDGADLRAKVLPLIRIAEGERFRNPALHAEMFENIRFDVGWRRSCEEALPPGSLEVEPPLRVIFRLMRHWPFMRILNLVGAYRQLGWRAGDLPCRLAPHIGVISAMSLADCDQIDAGRAFERAWLSITQYGLAMQALPASTLYAQSGALDQGIPSALQARLRAGWEQLLPTRTPLMLFRMGHARAPSQVAGRFPAEHYLKT